MDVVRGQDVIVAAGLFALDSRSGAQSELARLLSVPRSRVSESVRRLERNGLYSRPLRRLRSARLHDFLVHGLPWLFPAEPGEVVLGMPTSHAGPVLDEMIAASQAYVWPDEEGSVAGRAVTPVHPRAVDVARALPGAYALLSLADAMRVGRVREKRIATDHLAQMLRR
jgi:DNA-binding Lrp family transcriptional regulator